MKYIRSRADYLKFHRSEKINEGGLENEIAWGDSLVGRLFSSIFRTSKTLYDAKRIGTKVNQVERVLRDSVLGQVKDEGLKEKIDVLKSEIKNLGSEEGLRSLLEKGDVEVIKSFIENNLNDEDGKSVIDNIINGDDTIKKVLLAIEAYTPKEEVETEEEDEEDEGEEEVETEEEDKVEAGDVAKNIDVYLKADDNTLDELISDKILLVRFFESVLKLTKKDKKLNSVLTAKLGSNVPISEIISEIISGTLQNRTNALKKQLNSFNKGSKLKMKNDDSTYTFNNRTGNVLSVINDKKKEEKIDLDNAKSVERVEKIFKSEDPKDLDKRLEDYKKKLQKELKVGDEVEWTNKNGDKKRAKIISFTNQVGIGPDNKFITTDDETKGKLSSKQIYLSIDGKKGFAMSVDRVTKIGESVEFLLEFNQEQSEKIYPKIINRKVIGTKKAIKNILLGINDHIESMDTDDKKKLFKDKFSKIFLGTNESVEYSSVYEFKVSDNYTDDGEPVELETDKEGILLQLKINKESESLNWKQWFTKNIGADVKNNNKTELNNKLVEINKDFPTEGPNTQYIVDIIPIVDIFTKAARLFTKSRIPSGQTGGKISNARANNWEKMDGSGVNQENPGAGPFRNIKLYDKWNSGILKVMNDYSHVLKGGNTVVRLSDTDGSGKGNLVKPSKSLWQFMLDALEGGKITGLATGNNATQQHAFLVGYFGDGIKKEKTTTDSTETSTKATGATGATGSTGEEVDKVEYFKETDFIDVSTSNLYRTEVLGSINSSDSGSILPNAPNEVVYMYVSKNGDDKYIYLFEDLNFINNKVGDDVKYNKVPKPESASGVVLVARVDNDVRDGKLSANTNFQYVKGGSDEVVSLSTKGFDINKIEVYSDPSDDEARMTMSMVGEDFVFEKGLTQNTFKNDN